MKIKVNGKDRFIQSNKCISLNETIKILGYSSSTVVVELNKLIINSEEWDEKYIQELSEYSKRKEEIEIDLNEQNILYGNKKLKFNIEAAKKKRLLEGLDNIGLSLKKIPNIEKFENSMNKTKPWI